ncbi:hypothetical protein FRC10_008068 [Ceratobasidium sp. 414]|nr:hypothetical protein FRC10_008068 [Ceratobasidium sp. 414]
MSYLDSALACLSMRPHPMARPDSTPPQATRAITPNPSDEITKSRELKFDEDNQQWYFGTKEPPRVKWLESVWHVTDLLQAKDPDFLMMLNEYYLCGHVVDPPDQDRLPVVPGGMKHWSFSRSRPAFSIESTNSEGTQRCLDHVTQPSNPSSSIWGYVRATTALVYI